VHDVDADARRNLAGRLPFVEVAPTDTIARTAVAAYVAELSARFPTGFDPGDPTEEELAELARPRGVFVVVRDPHRWQCAVACGGVRRLDPDTVEVKRMWVHVDWRGSGLGSRLLGHLEDVARALGCRRVVLDTNGTLTEAIALYERAGYRSIPRYNDNPYAQAWFEKPLPG
jgi:GNAT superfamily N-acetyltransferase